MPWLSCKTWASASSRRLLPTHTLTRQSAFMSSLLWGPSKSLISISSNSFVSCSNHNLLIPPDALYSQPQGAVHGPHCHDSAPCKKSQVSSHRLHASTSPSLFTAPPPPIQHCPYSYAARKAPEFYGQNGECRLKLERTRMKNALRGTLLSSKEQIQSWHLNITI